MHNLDETKEFSEICSQYPMHHPKGNLVIFLNNTMLKYMCFLDKYDIQPRQFPLWLLGLNLASLASFQLLEE